MLNKVSYNMQHNILEKIVIIFIMLIVYIDENLKVFQIVFFCYFFGMSRSEQYCYVYYSFTHHTEFRRDRIMGLREVGCSSREITNLGI